MSRLTGWMVLVLVALPAEASNPTRAQKVRPRPIQSGEPPLAVPVPAPQPAPAPVLASRLLETVLCLHRELATLVVTRLIGYRSEPTARAVHLLNEAEDLRQARKELRQLTNDAAGDKSDGP